MSLLVLAAIGDMLFKAKVFLWIVIIGTVAAMFMRRKGA